MSVEKSILTTIISNLNLSLIIGDVGDTTSLQTLDLLYSLKKYILSRIEIGDRNFESILQKIEEQIIVLEKTCELICNTNTNVLEEIVATNTPPTIVDNILDICYDGNFYKIDIEELLKEYSDYELNTADYIKISDISSNLDVTQNNIPVVVGQEYLADVEIKVALDYTPDNSLEYFTETINNNGNCVKKIYTINKNILETYTNNGYVITKIENGIVYLEKTTTVIGTLPKDTIVYIHIDTSSSFLTSDRDVIKNKVLDWYNNFILQYPLVTPNLIINTVPNDQISNNYAPGGALNNKAIITDTPSDDYYGNVSTESWLQNPLEGLLRQAYKEGIQTFTLSQFKQYAQNKSIVVFSFVDETHPAYHGDENSTSFIDTDSGDTSQPSIKYINHYNNFMNDLIPRLSFFKGTLYPITEPFDKFNDNFLLHAMAALEATVLTQTQVNDYLGSSKVSIYGTTNMQSKFYNNICVTNPYIDYPNLKSIGWQADLTKMVPISTTINSIDFSQELDEYLTNGTETEYTYTEYAELMLSELILSSSFSIEVKDNHATYPLWSNKAKITINWCFSCNLTNFP